MVFHSIAITGDIVYIPLQWSAWIVGVSVHVKAPSKAATCIWCPNPRLKEAATFPEENQVCVSHAIADSDNNKYGEVK